ncbi:unnamed protein product [Acanthoscelides obtectus]|uniref:Uncharacterized protein n=1 Tax=Acanthoscelides obtectus TaxID=200917 RepID=A0A9P0NZJ0_ACAOB|nr:unnamed protein product [Acanthoscelides obtectus]CAK1663795.1 hypothetical protein AOBTE_LOCUS23860 [Acanthoscelides obtectus]
MEIFITLLGGQTGSSEYVNVDLPFLARLGSDAIVNAMVVTQLYHLFKKTERG